MDAVEAALHRALSAAGAESQRFETGPYRPGLLRPLGSSELPSYVALASDGSGWTRIAWCTFHPLDEVLTRLSQELSGTHVVACIAESVSSSYLFAIRRSGETLFRAESSDDGDGIGHDTVVTDAFRAFAPSEQAALDFEHIAGCSRTLGLELEFDVGSCEWRTLKVSWPARAAAPKAAKTRRFFGLF
ncbi:hypothetical protein [Sorangium sp. So ce233]|uniref:hypothetical protein n=1 Tax=Sorangium sp. So ce233 TaxID=3133290 RepID=UPI003F5EE2B2